MPSKLALGLTALALCGWSVGHPAWATPRRHHRHIARPLPETYDPTAARARFEHYYERGGDRHDAVAAGDSAYFCDDRVATSDYICADPVPRQAAYGDPGRFAPAYVAAPPPYSDPIAVLQDLTSLGDIKSVFVGASLPRLPPN